MQRFGIGMLSVGGNLLVVFRKQGFDVVRLFRFEGARVVS
jgi:hypothetical protein